MWKIKSLMETCSDPTVLNGYGGRSTEKKPRECAVLFSAHALATGLKNKLTIHLMGSTYNLCTRLHP